MIKWLAILSFLFFSACEPIEFGEEKTYTVREGKHNSNFPSLIINGKVIRCQVMFTESCRYARLELDGWNKLIGLASNVFDIDNDDNSARWAWRYDYDTELIKLASYIYVDGVKEIKYHFSVPVGVWTNLYIGYNKQLTKWEYYTVDNESIGGYTKCDKFKQKDFRWLGLYFGGESEAPHNVHVHYKFLK